MNVWGRLFNLSTKKYSIWWKLFSRINVVNKKAIVVLLSKRVLLPFWLFELPTESGLDSYPMSSYLSVFYFDVCAFPPEIWDYLHGRKRYIDRVNLEIWVFVGLATSSYTKGLFKYVLVMADDWNIASIGQFLVFNVHWWIIPLYKNCL